MTMRITQKLPKEHASQSLKSKLVLSYLVVILGTVLVLSIAVTLTIQNYFYQFEVRSVTETANQFSMPIIPVYQRNGSGWGYIPQGALTFSNLPSSSTIYITDSQGKGQSCQEPFPHGNAADICDSAAVGQIISQVLHTNEAASGQITFQSDTTQSQPMVYAVVPLKYGDQTIGALLYMQPQFNSLQQGIIDQIRIVIWLSGFGIALVAAICAYMLVRSIIQPLNTLTVAVERMKRGQYTNRVPETASQDELGLLSQTFNEMANKIESDVNELRQQDQMRRDLIANIAHDLATPLTAIQGLSEALADDVVSDPEIRQETAQRIGREVQRLRRMVGEVRQMTQMEAGQVRMDLAPLDLHTLADETVIVIEPECEQMGITIKNTIPSSIPLVEADSDRVTQVLLNLLDNARRHTQRDGKIRISATPREGSVVVTVSDTGVGINPADLPHIFERFYRADRSRTTQSGGGSGLGLAIVKAIVNAHGGQVWAESTLGQGTKVHFTLPISRAIASEPPTLAARTRSSSSAR
ncbi:HAMP domain-containing histidine kinase [Ktedonobacteria bacterium brp13]|nr:HAMP domain-containing histidine kinase [Ktedonobacteria bacterium brp13]